MKYTFLLIVSITFLACKKDSDSKESGKTQMLTSAEWKYDTGGIADANGNIIADISTIGGIPPCLLDNSVRFNADGTGTVSENADVCTGLPATSPITWSFSSNETVLNLSAGAIAGIGGNFKLKELTDAKLALFKDTTASILGTTTPVTVVINLKH